MRFGWKWAAVAVGAVVLGGAGTALATGGVGILGADGVIHGCYQTENGMLRVVAEGSTCRDAELAIRWNEQGLQGERGLQGEQGPAGAQGPKGDTGAAGATGEQGLRGEKGDKGDKGDTGATGLTGARGEPGPAGADGSDGAPGEPGPPGLSGLERVDADGVQNGTIEQLREAMANCPSGKRAVGGGYAWEGFYNDLNDKVVIGSSRPFGLGWRVTAFEVEEVGRDWNVRAFAICAFVD